MDAQAVLEEPRILRHLRLRAYQGPILWEGKGTSLWTLVLSALNEHILDQDRHGIVPLGPIPDVTPL